MSTTNAHCRTCAYYGSTLQSCDFILITGTKRGCPAGKVCTRYEKRGKAPRKPIMNFPGSPTFAKPIQPSTGGRKVLQVKQMDMDGNLIRLWPSASAAAEALNVYVGNIHKCARGKQKSSHRFRWVYMKDGESDV